MTNIIDQINEVTDTKTDSELAKKLSDISGKSVDKSLISKWRNRGFSGSTKALIILLLKQIKGK